MYKLQRCSICIGSKKKHVYIQYVELYRALEADTCIIIHNLQSCSVSA